MKLRQIKEDDKDLLFNWRNMDQIVALSSTQRKVEYTEHSKWFSSVLNSDNILAFIIENDSQNSIGHLRFEKYNNNECTITVYLVPSRTGKGLGTEAILKGCIVASKRLNISKVIANVRTENLAGQSAFKKAGFRPTNLKKISKHTSFLLTFENLEVEKTRKTYEKLYTKHGDSYKSLNWGSQDGQQLRFRILAEIGDISQKHILDVGCGLGHFADWLQTQGIEVMYTGLDVTVSMLDAARKRLSQHDFVEGDFLDESILEGRTFDYVFASGLFYTYKGGALEWQKKTILKLWDLAEKGVAFNNLSSWAEHKEPDEYYSDPCMVLGFCGKITPRVVLRHDYHPGDFTIYMNKQPHS